MRATGATRTRACTRACSIIIIHTGSSIKPFALFVDSSSNGPAAAFRPRPTGSRVSVDDDDDDNNQQQQTANQRISVHVTMRSKQQPRPSYRWQTKGARGELVGTVTSRLECFACALNASAIRHYERARHDRSSPPFPQRCVHCAHLCDVCTPCSRRRRRRMRARPQTIPEKNIHKYKSLLIKQSAGTQQHIIAYSCVKRSAFEIASIDLSGVRACERA